jgi:murein DD-endopeptidase MepM/ murein hydrolase activator NlpD
VYENPSDSPSGQAFTRNPYRIQQTPPAGTSENPVFFVRSLDAGAKPARLRAYISFATASSFWTSELPTFKRLKEELGREGIDFVADTGTKVIASAGGVVVAAEVHPQYGKMVEIDHGNDFSSRYAHLSRLDVKQGQVVRRGQPIGASGSTGRSTGPHLHFEVRFKGVAQNPARFLQQRNQMALVSREETDRGLLLQKRARAR